MNVGADIDEHLGEVLRETCLAVILVLAGLEIDLQALLHEEVVVFTLSILPMIVEAGATCLAGYYLLDLPPVWGLLLGFILGAVSPAIVVPSLLQLQKGGYGVDKGIPSLVVGASSLDDVFAIAGIGVVASILFSSGESIGWVASKGPVELAVGVMWGCLQGYVVWLLLPTADAIKPYQRGGSGDYGLEKQDSKSIEMARLDNGSQQPEAETEARSNLNDQQGARDGDSSEQGDDESSQDEGKGEGAVAVRQQDSGPAGEADSASGRGEVPEGVSGKLGAVGKRIAGMLGVVDESKSWEGDDGDDGAHHDGGHADGAHEHK